MTSTPGKCLLFLLLLLANLARAADRGNLLVSAYGHLLLISPRGEERSLAEQVNLAALSPDGRSVAFTNQAQALQVIDLPSRAARQIVRLPDGKHFEDIEWFPGGSAVAYTTSGELFLALATPERGAPRSLGPWYQGFSFSPDGKRVVHAVNGPPTPGLEVLEIATGKRTLAHKVKSVVWDARYSPDGQYIAYRATIREPGRSTDEPDCTSPTLGLRLYSVARRTDAPLAIRAAPKNWDDVKTFTWSPDSRRIALTLGTTGCDYPGDAAGVFVLSVDRTFERRVSRGEMSFEPAFSPDGSAVAFVDFSESPARLVQYDLENGGLRLIRRATVGENSYRLFDWR